MNLIQRLSVNGSISSEEMSKLSAIRAGLINSMECGQLRTMEFIRKTFEDCSAEECEKLAGMVDTVKLAFVKEVAAKYGVDTAIAVDEIMDEGMFKNAGGEASALERFSAKLPSSVKTTALAAILGTLGLSLLHSATQGVGMISNPITGLINRIGLKKDSGRILSEILEENPELKKDEKVMEYFAALQKFAPHTVATNKPLAESLLKKMHQWGQIDPQTMSQIVEMEGRYLENISGKGKGKGEGFRPMGPGDLAAVGMGAG